MTLGMESVLAGFFYADNFTAFVVPTLGAGAVRHFALMAIWTLGERMRSQGVVRPPRAGAFLGVSPFRIRHRNSSQ